MTANTAYSFGTRPTHTPNGEPIPADALIYVAPRPLHGTLTWRAGNGLGAHYAAVFCDGAELRGWMIAQNEQDNAELLNFVTFDQARAALKAFYLAEYGAEAAAEIDEAEDFEIRSSFLYNALAPLDPDTNTEAAQLDADLAEQPADIDALRAQYVAARAAELAERNPATIKAASRAWSQLQAAQTSPATLLDDVATLPLFSGTAPRVADPGRFDPPQISTDTQPALF